MVENRGGACKNPWRWAWGKRFLERFCWLLWCEVYPVGCHGPWWGKIPEADGGGRAAPDPGLRRRRIRVRAGLESEGGHLVLLVADAQREVVQGAANDGVGAVIQRLERAARGRPASQTPPVRGRGHWAAAAAVGSGVVSSGSMFGSTQCLRKLLEKNFRRKFWRIQKLAS